MADPAMTSVERGATANPGPTALVCGGLEAPTARAPEVPAPVLYVARCLNCGAHSAPTISQYRRTGWGWELRPWMLTHYAETHAGRHAWGFELAPLTPGLLTHDTGTAQRAENAGDVLGGEPAAPPSTAAPAA